MIVQQNNFLRCFGLVKNAIENHVLEMQKHARVKNVLKMS